MRIASAAAIEAPERAAPADPIYGPAFEHYADDERGFMLAVFEELAVWFVESGVFEGRGGP